MAGEDVNQSLPIVADDAEPKLRPLNILIAIPSGDTVKAGFAYSLARAMVHFASIPYDGEKQFDVTIVKSSVLPEQRTILVGRAHEQGATHILWLDSDMKFPADTIARLLNHNKLIVGVNYATKEIASRPTAYRDDDEYTGPVWTKEESAGLEQVRNMGMGVLLVDMKVFDAMELPYFEMKAAPPTKVKIIPEDLCFFLQAQELGIESWVDHDLSKQCAHIGDFEYTCDFAAISEQTKQKLYKELP